VSEKQEEFPISLRLLDSQNNRVAYKKLSLKEFLMISAIIQPVRFIDLGGEKMTSCCYNKECPQQVNSKCIAGYKDSICKDRKASFNALDFIKSKQTLNKPISKSTSNPRQ